MNNEKMTTPKGIALYPHLDKPDTKFDDPGVYQMSLRLQRDEGVELQNTLQEILNKHIDLVTKQAGKPPTIKQLPIKENTDAEGNEVLDFKFKLKSVLKTRSGEEIEQRPSIFDAGLKPMINIAVGNGSTVKVSFVAAPYQGGFGAGISLRLNAVQVIDLVQYNRGAESGLAAEEGYAFEDEPKAPTMSIQTIGGDEATEATSAASF